MKYGLRIINNSPVVDKGGVVYVYTASQRVITAAKLTLMTCDQLDDMFDDIIAMNGAQPYGAEAFTGQGCSWHGYPTDSTTYVEFDDWNGQMIKSGSLEVADGFAEHWSLTPGVTDVKPRGISTTFVCFEAPSRAQLYTLNYRAAWYTRWPLGTVLGQNMPHIPDANPAGSNAHRKKGRTPEVSTLRIQALASSITQLPRMRYHTMTRWINCSDAWTRATGFWRG
jgi:hypothetical protein